MAKDLGLTAIHVTHDQSEAMAISDRIAVMKKGKVVQVGTPYELYMNPKNIFVAHFIGESNFLEGYISNISGKEAVIELRGGVKVHASCEEMKRGDRVVLAVRPETFIMEKGVRKGKNALGGFVEKVSFQGTNIRYEVRLENQDLVVVVKPSLTEEWFNTGEKVTVSFPSDKAHVFSYPSVGLKEEVAVE
jgi:ABC-type Fe3+/spermidine/putrescine transport system ATPase subunit